MRDMARVGLVPSPTVSHGGRKALVLFTLCLGVLVALVDTSVVNLAIQSIGSSLVAPVPALQWVLDAYNLTYAALLLTGGLIADLYGQRLAFQRGAAALTVASLGCLRAVDWLPYRPARRRRRGAALACIALDCTRSLD
jgi:MFS family permease